MIDKLRLQRILLRGRVPEAPSIEFADALQDTFDAQLSPLVTESALDLAVARIEKAIAESEARQARAMGELHRMVLAGVGMILAGLTVAVGLILGFN